MNYREIEKRTDRNLASRRSLVLGFFATLGLMGWLFYYCATHGAWRDPWFKGTLLFFFTTMVLTFKEAYRTLKR